MKEILLLFGLAGIAILIAAAVNKWGTAEKLKGITGKVGHLDISFWWRLVAMLLIIGIAVAIWPDIVMWPWRKNRLATALGGLLLLGLLIQWARQGKEKREGGSLLAVAGVALIIATGLWGLWWLYQQANRPPESYAVERVAVQPPAPPPVRTWHGLTGGIERTMTVTGDVSEEIRLSSKQELKLDDWYPTVVWVVNKTNVLEPFRGTKTNSFKFEVVQFKSKDGTPVTMKVATGVPKS